MEIYCKAENGHDIVNAIADKFNCEAEVDANEQCVNLPESIGSGHVRSVSFDYGFSIVDIDFLLKNKIKLIFEEQVINPLYILFNLDSTVSHEFSSNNSKNTIKLLECLMGCSTTKEYQTLILKKGSPNTIFLLIINRKLFEPKIESFVEDMDEKIELLFRDVNGINHFEHKNFFTLEISKLIEELKNCDLSDFMKSTYLEGKAYEILTRHLENYINDSNDPEGKALLRNSTIKKIKNAVEIIESELEIRINVNALAKKVGLNQNTLQNGFKILFKKSVNEYIQHQKLERAKDLLENSTLNITEITYKIGINSRSYFSKIFKDKFGITPNQYLSQSRNKAS